jgi:exodeoxyribonuclease V alpha subunit
MQRGELGARNLNQRLQAALNGRPGGIERYGYVFREGDKVMQLENDYDKDVFNGDIGAIRKVDEPEREVRVVFEGREVRYDFQELDELALSYATTIHKSQGSEYPAVVIVLHHQHHVMLQRNLLYTAITRGQRLVVIVGSKRALGRAVANASVRERHSMLADRLRTALESLS